QLNSTASSELSYDTLRDFFLPVTSTARQNAAAQGFPLTGFKQIRDQVLTPGQGVHGVRETFGYTYTGGIADAVRIEVRTGWWVFVLAGLEVIRQIHFLISEHWRAYHRFWTVVVFGGFERTTHSRISDWSRFRLGRLLTWVLWIIVAAFVIGKIIHTT